MPRYFHGSVLSGIKRIDYDANPPAYSYRQGRSYWDTLDLTLAIMQNDGAEEVVNQVGQETAVWVRNESGVDIPNGYCVYYVGSIGQRPSVALARADSLATCNYLGVATQTIEHNSNGFVTLRGLVRGINTNAWNEGDILRLSPTVAGELQNTAAVTGYNIRVGIVLFKSAGAGVIYIAPDRAPAYGNILGGNFTQFGFDGTMQAFGDATCFDDILQSVTGAQITSPAGDFQQNIAEASVTAKNSALYPTDYITTNHQLTHRWKLGTTIYPHLHWWQTQAGVPNWLLGYRWQKQGGAKTTAWSNLPWASNASVWSAGTLNQITGFGGIAAPVGYGEVSDIVQIRIYRDVTNVSILFGGAEAALPDQDIVNFDTHVETDMLGSRQQYAK